MDLQVFYPEKAYPELYEDVMLLGIFPDSKTFADAVPLIPVPEILSSYQLIDRTDPQQVRNFVHQWFQLPQDSTLAVKRAKPIHQHITSLWKHLIKEQDKTDTTSSLIPLPYQYVVPGGRFREIYYWDSYFTMLGLGECGRTDIISAMVKNFAWQLEHIGHIPNGNRSYFLSRSQPPFFSLMVSLLAEFWGEKIYQENLQALLQEYSFWMNGLEKEPDRFRRIVKVGDYQYLNRYFDDSNAPRAESYSEDKKLFNENFKEPNEFYRNLRAACESGWDFSSRWFEKENDLSSIWATEIIPVDLNALLYILEKTIGEAYKVNGNNQEAHQFERFAQERADLVNDWLWNDDEGIYSDLIIQNNKYGIPSLAMMYPLFAGIATQQQAERNIQYLKNHFLRDGGWVTSNHNTGQQWDAPNGWAPLQWITFIALKKYGFTDLAKEGAMRWLKLNEDVFKRTGRMMEKYNVEDLSLDAGGGEYPVQDGFGWTNGVYLALVKELNTLSAE